MNISGKLLHHVFSFIDKDFKLLIHREDSSDEDIVKKLSIELIMRAGLEEYFKDVLLHKKFKNKLCNEAARRGYVSSSCRSLRLP